jgi:hypothetical protein
MKIYVAILLLSILFGIRPAYAVDIPSFPACSNPQGTIKSDFPSGTHGIVGSTATYTGSDKVYQIDSDKVKQCFCPSSGGSGIQTNWWKIPNLSDAEINIFKSQGWVYIPNGALWGLEEAPYLAINSDFSCGGSVNSANATSDPGSSSGGSVLATAASKAGEVLGLASTGNNPLFYSIFIGGVSSVLIGLIFHKKTSK